MRVELSGVCYLRVPKSLPEEYAREDHYPTVGDICLVSMVKRRRGQWTQTSRVTRRLATSILFPNWLAHGVYPFRTPNEERRSVSFNLHLIKKEEPAAFKKLMVDINKVPIFTQEVCSCHA